METELTFFGDVPMIKMNYYLQSPSDFKKYPYSDWSEHPPIALTQEMRKRRHVFDKWFTFSSLKQSSHTPTNNPSIFNYRSVYHVIVDSHYYIGGLRYYPHYVCEEYGTFDTSAKENAHVATAIRLRKWHEFAKTDSSDSSV